MDYQIEISTKDQSHWQGKHYNALVEENTRLLVFIEDDIIVGQNPSLDPLTPLKQFAEESFKTSLKYYLGMFLGSPLYAVMMDPKAITRDLPDEDYSISFKTRQIMMDGNLCVAHPLRTLLETQPNPLSNLLCRAKQLIHWHKTSLFCSACGGPCRYSDIETAKICQHCDRVIYPHTSPAVLVLIENNNQILLARSPYFRQGVYSVLAGFVEAGESLEQTIDREVLEEVGIKVKNVRYFGSQPWPFQNSFMVAFRAEYASGDININPQEIEDAQWFSMDQLPLLPFKASLSHKMIEAYLEEKRGEHANQR